MNDLISRQAVIDAFGLSEKTRKYGGDHSGYDTMMLYEIQDVIEGLPSVNPQASKEDIHREREQAYMKGYEDASKRYRTEPCEDAISRAEAIRIASGYCHWTNIPDELAKLPSVNPKPCEDAISRQAVLEGLASIAKAKARSDAQKSLMGRVMFFTEQLPSVSTENPNRWISVSEKLPETDNKNSINNYNVLLWVKNKTHPEYEPQIYLGKLRHVDGDDGSGNFFGLETKPCDWTIWAWHYFHEPEVIAWMPLPQPYEPQESDNCN